MRSTSQLNIKNPEARQLALELAAITGESVTEAVVVSLRERLESKKKLRSRKGLAERLMAIGREASKLPVLDDRSPEDMLYDEFGLPK